MTFSKSVAVVLPSTLALLPLLLLPTNFDWMKYASILSSSSSIPDDDGHNVVCSTEEDNGDLLVGGNVPSCMVVEEGAMVNIFVTGGSEKELECTVGAGVVVIDEAVVVVVVVVVDTLLAMVR